MCSQRCTPSHERKCVWLGRFTLSDWAEHAVQVLSQRHRCGELVRIIVGAVDLSVAGQQSRRDRPLANVLRCGKVVASERRPPVDCVDEIDDRVVAGEVERSARRDGDDRRTIPDRYRSEVSSDVLALTVAPIAPVESTIVDLRSRSG